MEEPATDTITPPAEEWEEEGLQASKSPHPNKYQPRHKFKRKYFYVMLKCDVCGHPFVGPKRSGLNCVECDLKVHLGCRKALSTKLASYPCRPKPQGSRTTYPAIDLLTATLATPLLSRLDENPLNPILHPGMYYNII